MFKNMNKLVKTASIGLVASAIIGSNAIAANWSSTKVEGLYGYDYKRGPRFSEVNEGILTLANASGFDWGDTFVFIDTTNVDDVDGTGGAHMEFSGRYNFHKGTKDGAIKGFFGIVQADITSNRFTQKITKMAGLSVDWNMPGMRFFKTHLQYRDDPTLDGTSVQFNLVWNKGFKIGEQDFSFEGFLDYTTSEGTTVSNTLAQPQLLWHANKSLAIGIEYQYWKNRLGVDGINESSPQVMVRWTF